MATIEQRTNGAWRVKVRKHGYPVQTRTFTTKSRAKRWASLVESDMERGVFISLREAASTTLHELLSRYLSEITPLKKGAAPETARLKAMIKDPICQLSLAALQAR